MYEEYLKISMKIYFQIFNKVTVANFEKVNEGTMEIFQFLLF
jgi:hypothetical protein